MGRLLILYLFFALRSRLPLYHDDRSQTSRRFRAAVLRVLRDKRTPRRAAQWSARAYACAFQSAEDVRLFVAACADGNRGGFFNETTAAGEMPAQTGQRVFAARLRQFSEHQHPARAQTPEDVRPIRTLVFASAPPSPQSLAQLSQCPSIVVLVGHHHGDDLIFNTLAASTHAPGAISRRNLIRDNAPAFSEPEKQIADLCDCVAADILDAATSTRSIARALPEFLAADAAQHLSDVFYRAAEDANALLHEAQHLSADEQLVLIAPPPSLAKAVSAVAPEHTTVIVLDGVVDAAADRFAQSGVTKLEPLHPGARPLLRLFRRLQRRIDAALPDDHIFANGGAFIAADRRTGVYRRAGDLAMEALSADVPTGLINVGAAEPAPFLRSLLAPNLHAAIHAPNLSETSIFAYNAEIALTQSLAAKTIAGVSASALQDVLSAELHRHIRAVIGCHILQKRLSARLFDTPTTLLLAPGFNPIGASMARAFQANKQQTIDIQAVLISEHPRYKAPITEHCSVIDSFSANIYTGQFGVDPSRVHQVGSLTLEAELADADQLNQASIYDSLFRGRHASGNVVVYATQPLIPLDDQIAAARALGNLVRDDDSLSLCVKLHPAQPDADRMTIVSALTDSLNTPEGERWRVLHHEPFARAFAVTDILVSYFSNVCLMGAARGVPVLTLPTRVKSPALTMSDMGVATEVADLADLPSAIHVARTAGKEHSTGSNYMQHNAHIGDGQASTRLSALVKATLQR
ncbi:MAG: hypothetical protein GXP04_02300 [Alphaproteobacteria bacterium]|nr:hypothetical protein [Alphaproteobacteria bacterium]